MSRLRFLGVPLALALLALGCAGTAPTRDGGDGALGDGDLSVDTFKDPRDVDGDGDGYTPNQGDCDDTDNKINPAGVEICGDNIDQNCDGSDLVCSNLDQDGDGYSPNQGDCDDNNKDVNPGATEVPYNMIDDDCNTQTPDDDLDGDGFSKLGGGDCNDNDNTIFPGATETPYDGIDQDCSGKDLVDFDKDGYDAVQAGGTDCDDMNANINPGAAEIPFDTTDQNCDGKDIVDNGAFVVRSAPNLYDPVRSAAVSTSSALVAWREYDSTNQIYYIRAQRITATAKSGSVYTVHSQPTTSGTIYGYLALASDASGYLVAFAVREGTASPYSYKVYGRRLTSTGSPNGGLITLRSSTTTSQRDIGAAYAGSRYAVSFVESGTMADVVYVQMVTASTGALYGGIRTVTDGAQNDNYSEIASSGSSFLVVFRRLATDYDIYGRVMTTSGTMSGNPFAISSATGHQYQPHAIYGGSSYLVVWDDYRSSNYDVYGQRVTGSGTLSGANFAISTVASSQYRPRVTYCGSRWVVAWRDSRHSSTTIYGQTVNSSGALEGSQAFNNRIIYATTATQSLPDVICAGQTATAVIRNDISGADEIVGVPFTP
ncbi:MAG: putative metal-binding motif-containing protein [Myxococcales bacterium]|nr:putative metal-binding motif-containing protein [Myxococcales bacterium]